MISVWIVSIGMYSGRRIFGVYPDFKSAQHTANYIIENDNYADLVDIEEHEIYESYPDSSLDRYHNMYDVIMKTDGNKAMAILSTCFYSGANVSLEIGKKLNQKDGTYYLKCLIAARSEEHAIKICNERRTMWLAGGSKLKPDTVTTYNFMGQDWREAIY